MTPGVYAYVPLERVVWGEPAVDAVPREVDRLGARRVFVVASKTLSRQTDAIERLKAALGPRYVGLFDEGRAHTPFDTVLACAEAVRAAGPDLILTVGGGTPTDMVKVVQLCLTHGVLDMEGLAALAGKRTAEPSSLRQIIVPTTLSGGEYSSAAGATNTATRTKESFLGPDLCARAVILDPAITRLTPERLWLSTAIRALDHAVEGYCATATNPLVQATALKAVSLFADSLRRTKADPDDLEARQASQMATWLAASSLGRVPMGASHGIGYLLGAMHGVPHGETSCVMLPAVLRWNEPETRAAQKDIAAALGRPELSASEAVGELISDLALPRTLGDVGIGRDDIPALAERAAVHPVVRANPRPVRSASDAAEILELAR